MKRSLAILVTSVVVVSSGLLGARPASAAAGTEVESVVVTGRGEVSGEPDLLTIEFAVEANAATVGEALGTANKAAGKMRDALVRAGIAKADLQTSNVGVSSRMNDDRQIVGYTVNQGITAKTRDLPKAGALMSTAIAAGGDAARLNGVTFGIEDDAALLAEARKKAFADARGKAELYARESGRTLGRVVKVSEATPGVWAPGAQYDMGGSDARFSVDPGRQQLTATITVEWAFR
jgi:uncharacterized protein YggE